jgi:energy-converting hydrogenase Eha subunit H
MEWLISQISHFNLFQFIAILFFVVTFQKSNTTKLLDKQTQEFHEEIEELKDVIRWNHNGNNN